MTVTVRVGCVALVALAVACASAPIEPAAQRELRSASASGREAFLHGDLRVAQASFASALALARAADDPHEVGNAAYDLATVRSEQGERRDAEALLAEARAAFVRAGEHDAAMETDLLAVRAHLDDGALDTAERMLATMGASLPANASLRARAELLSVDLAAQRGDAEAARRALQAACTALRQPIDAASAPDLIVARARVLLLDGDAAGAAAAFEQAATRDRELHLGRRMAHALDAAGDALHQAGRDAEAADRWLRAAAAFAALGDPERWQVAARHAAELAEALADPALAARARALLETR